MREQNSEPVWRHCCPECKYYTMRDVKACPVCGLPFDAPARNLAADSRPPPPAAVQRLAEAVGMPAAGKDGGKAGRPFESGDFPPFDGEERVLLGLCERELSRRGIVAFHVPPKQRCMKGYPDLTFVIARVPYAIELKNIAGCLEPAQKDCLVRMALNGWTVAVCRSFEAFLSAIGGNDAAH